MARLRSVFDDIGSILLLECPPSLRLALLLLALLTAHALGLLWLFSADYHQQAVRSEVHQELHEMRQELRSMSDVIEYVKTGHDVLELRVRRNGR